MKQKNILFVVAECTNFVATGGLAEVAGSLPKAIMKANRGYKVRVMMPLYKVIANKYHEQLKFLGETTVVLAWRRLYCGVFNLKLDGVDYYFIDNKYYFDRDLIYGHYDDGERFAFFSKSVFETFNIIGFIPNIIHSHDWHTALVNIYLDLLYKKQGYYTEIKSLFTIHNIEFQGIFDLPFLEDIIGIDKQHQAILEYNGLVNLIKGAIVCSDLISTVSPRYAREITTAMYASGLEHITRTNGQKIVGVINGIDTDFYNPNIDPALPVNYNVETFANKLQNKEALQRGLNLMIDANTCVISMISRLTNQKGVDLVIDKFDEMMKENVQFVLLGKGNRYFEDKFLEISKRYPKRVSILITYDTNLAKKIYGGSDLFLMPSKMEPCGLSQMIASRYGTVPIVRATGGLFDTIKDYNNGQGNGFVFKDFDAQQMLEKIKEAIELFNNREQYNALAKKIMNIDFSWQNSALSYLQMYKDLLTKK
ncbi:MAG: glycogen synthase GlgA [Bacilli bacterium]